MFQMFHNTDFLPGFYFAGTCVPWRPTHRRFLISRSNSVITASSTRSVSSSIKKLPWYRIFIFGSSQFPVNDQLDGHGPAYTFFCRRGNCFIIGIGMKAVAVIINSIQGLQGGSDIIEVNFLRMQAAPDCLNMIF